MSNVHFVSQTASTSISMMPHIMFSLDLHHMNTKKKLHTIDFAGRRSRFQIDSRFFFFCFSISFSRRFVWHVYFLPHFNWPTVCVCVCVIRWWDVCQIYYIRFNFSLSLRRTSSLSIISLCGVCVSTVCNSNRRVRWTYADIFLLFVYNSIMIHWNFYDFFLLQRILNRHHTPPYL